MDHRTGSVEDNQAIISEIKNPNVGYRPAASLLCIRYAEKLQLPSINFTLAFSSAWEGEVSLFGVVKLHRLDLYVFIFCLDDVVFHKLNDIIGHCF